jgi:hypothetical protein
VCADAAHCDLLDEEHPVQRCAISSCPNDSGT